MLDSGTLLTFFGGGTCGVVVKGLADYLLERAKTPLRSAAFARETQFAWYCGERGRVLTQMYERLGDVRTMSHLIAEAATLGKPQDDLHRQLRKNLDAVIEHLNRTQLFIDPVLRESVRNFAQESYEAAGLLKRVTSVFDEGFSSWRRSEQRLIDLLERIEAAFRQSLSLSGP
jgi:hypothetical protein